jgi:hypothetical protein
MLTNFQLEDLAKRMNFPLEAVCFKDEIPKLKFNKSYIINLENAEDEEGNPNQGSHWVCMQVNKYPNDKIEGIFFDPYGVSPPEEVKRKYKELTGLKTQIPYTSKDVQSLMADCCGFYCSAFLHFINSSIHRKKDLYLDANTFMEMYDDLNVSIDFKKNEWVLKNFFREADGSKRTPVEVLSEKIISKADTGKGVNMMAIPVAVKMRE